MKRIIAFFLLLTILMAGSSFLIVFADSDWQAITVPNYSFEEGQKGVYRTETGVPGWTAFNTFLPGNEAGTTNFLFYALTDNIYMAGAPGQGAAKDGTNLLSLADQFNASGVNIYSDPIPAFGGLDYKMQFSLWTDYRAGHGMFFFNSDGKLYYNGKWVEATQENLIAACTNNYTVGASEGKKWIERESIFSAPMGTTSLRLVFFTAIGSSGNPSIDNVRLFMDKGNVKSPVAVPNGDFEKNMEIPGWTQFFYIGEREDYYGPSFYYALSSAQKSDGLMSLRIFDDGNAGGVYLHSDAIETGAFENLTLTVSVKATNQRAYHGIQFFQKGADGIIGTNDDLVYTGGSYTASTGVTSGGSFKKLSDSIYNVAGTPHNGYLASTTDWHDKTSEFLPIEGTDYVRVLLMQNINQGGYYTYFDNIRLSKTEGSNVVNLPVNNHSFEQKPVIPNWSDALNSTFTKGTDAGKDLYYLVTDDRVLEGKKGLYFYDDIINTMPMVWSDPIQVYEGFSYIMRFNAYSGYRTNYGMKFFNQQGQVYDFSTNTYVAPTLTNLIKGEMNNTLSGTGNVYYQFATGETGINENIERVLEVAAPKDAVYVRLAFFTRYNQSTNMYIDNVRLYFTPKAGVSASLPYFTENGEAIIDGSELVAGDILKASVKLYNNTDEEKNVSVILVKYDEDGRVEAVSTQKATLPWRNPNTFISQSVSVEVELPVPETNEGAYKIFVWDGFGFMKSYRDSIQLNYQ